MVLFLHCVLMFHIFSKFRENISKSYGVIERTRFVTDRWMDRGRKQTNRQLLEKQYVRPKYGRHTYLEPIIADR